MSINHESESLGYAAANHGTPTEWVSEGRHRELQTWYP
jgi:hypothetical protein